MAWRYASHRIFRGVLKEQNIKNLLMLDDASLRAVGKLIYVLGIDWRGIMLFLRHTVPRDSFDQTMSSEDVAYEGEIAVGEVRAELFVSHEESRVLARVWSERCRLVAGQELGG
jgi:hypothetical protein